MKLACVRFRDESQKPFNCILMDVSQEKWTLTQPMYFESAAKAFIKCDMLGYKVVDEVAIDVAKGLYPLYEKLVDYIRNREDTFKWTRRNLMFADKLMLHRNAKL